MMQPTIAAPIAATRTAPAAQSLAFFASGWMFSVAKLDLHESARAIPFGDLTQFRSVI